MIKILLHESEAGFFYIIIAVSRAISIIWVNEVSRSLAVVASPVARLSETVHRASAFLLSLAAVI